jgi:regulator of sigma E protease
MNFAVAVAGLAFLILIHEAGHFFTALAVRMRPRRFYIFFPPALVKWKRNGIEYGIGMIPLGGYVKIPGMHKPAARDLEGQLERALEEAPWLERYVGPVNASLEAERLDDARDGLPDLRQAVARAELSEPARRAAERTLTDVEDALSSDAYWRAPVWKRVAVILAGPATNLIFAVAALAAVFAIGVPVATQIHEVTPGSPASAAGLRPGDEILAVDGETVSPVLTEQLPSRIAASKGEPMTLRIERGGQQLTLRPVSARLEDDDVYRLGIRLRAEEKAYGPWESVEYAARETWAITAETGKVLGRIFTGSGREEVSSPVGIVRGSAEAVDVGFDVYLRILALISLSLALLNLLPLLPLDGGHIAFSLAEGVRGRAIPREAYERASMVGIVLVLFLFFIGLNNDIGGRGGG